MTKGFRIVVGGLAVVGAMAIVTAAAGVALALRARHIEKSPGPADLAYILNREQLSGATKIKKIRCGYASEQSPTVGDQTKVYILELAPFNSSIFENEKGASSWRRGPVADALYREALETAATFAAGTPCRSFPSYEVLNSERFVLSFPEITAYDGRTEVVVVTAYDRETGLLYHADVRW